MKLFYHVIFFVNIKNFNTYIFLYHEIHYILNYLNKTIVIICYIVLTHYNL